MIQEPRLKTRITSLLIRCVLALVVAAIAGYYLNDVLMTYIQKSKEQFSQLRQDVDKRNVDMQSTLSTALREFAKDHPQASITTLRTKEGDLRAVILTKPTPTPTASLPGTTTSKMVTADGKLTDEALLILNGNQESGQ